MADTNTSLETTALPDWWQREKQRRQLYFLVFLIAVLLLIGYYYWASRTEGAQVVGANFDTTNYIAFVRRNKEGNTDLYAIRADGFGLRPLTDLSDKSSKETPVWTMDGKRLIYASTGRDMRTWQIYLLGEGEATQLTYGTGNKSAPMVSPDGQRFGFIAQGAVKSANLNGTDVYQLMPQPNSGEGAGDETKPTGLDAASSLQGAFRSVVFSADGRGCAGVKDVNGEENPTAIDNMTVGSQAAFAIPPNGDKSVLLNMGREVSLAWEPNGSRIACAFGEMLTKDPANNKDQLVSGIVIWNFQNPTRPTAHPIFLAHGYTLEPRNIAWSPDGSKLAFEGWRIRGENDRELRGIVVMDARAGYGIKISTPKEADMMQYMIPASKEGKPQHPLWSPDGKRLLYEMQRKDGKHDIWVVNADGTDPMNLTKGEKDGTDNTQAVWSPVRLK
ncbi:MAG TPA: hypothetical protein VFB38_22725 [Chthonomonadaceae bacterium]|nr:hypothetical protein [Chthonomonadaceae bacterium]